jgi:hypothetical protein
MTDACVRNDPGPGLRDEGPDSGDDGRRLGKLSTVSVVVRHRPSGLER